MWACGRGAQEDMKREAAYMFVICWWELLGVAESVRLGCTEHMDLHALCWKLHMHRLLLRDHKPQPLVFSPGGMPAGSASGRFAIVHPESTAEGSSERFQVASFSFGSYMASL